MKWGPMNWVYLVQEGPYDEVVEAWSSRQAAVKRVAVLRQRPGGSQACARRLPINQTAVYRESVDWVVDPDEPILGIGS